MLRWYLVPRNRWFNVYLHKIVRSDDDRALHDHPWASLSVIINGRYVEQTDAGRRSYRCGSIIYRGSGYRHRIEVATGECAWTLFITGPKVREWGFWCPKGFVVWHEFVDINDTGSVGRGCGEK